MPNQKVVVKQAAKTISYLFGMLLVLMFAMNFEGMRTYSDDLFGLIAIFIVGCFFMFLGIRQQRNDSSSEAGGANSIQRFTHYYLDSVIHWVIIITIVTLFPEFFYNLIRSYGEVLVFGILFLVVFIGYYFLFESICQRTPAKFLTNSKVVTEDFGKPNILSILLRSVCRLIPFDPLSIFTEKGLWHDQWSKTYVVSE